MRLSIRWRLTLWNTLALALVLVGFSALVYWLLAEALNERLDRSLLAELNELEKDDRMANRRDERLRHWIYEFKEHENISCVVYDSTGKVHERTLELPAAAIPPAPRARAGEPTSGDMTLPIIGHQRILATSVALGDEEFTVLLLAPLEEVDREMGQLMWALAMAVPMTVLLTGITAYWLARKALAPVKELDRSTQEITADRLDRRLSVSNPTDELGRLTQTINEMIGRLERSFAEIRRFTADASHEIRTPLTAIRTETEVALRKPLSASDCQALLGSVLEECDRLTRLTDQLLTLARQDAGVTRSALENVDLALLVKDVTETLRPLAENKGLHLVFHADEPAKVSGDNLGLRQVFFNVLDNAIKYTPSGGSITVQMKHSDGQAIVTIKDTGIGIPPEHLPHVFDRFYRVDKARSRAEGGTGLGLSIARGTVSAHGGRIELTSAPGQGTTCIITLPTQLVPESRANQR
jgi:heavy metal sensor kinase